MGDFLNKAKDFLGDHPEQTESAIDKVGDFVDEKTGNKHSEHIDTAQEKAKEFLDGDKSGR